MPKAAKKLAVSIGNIFLPVFSNDFVTGLCLKDT
jgi:hypothetical protein